MACSMARPRATPRASNVTKNKTKSVDSAYSAAPAWGNVVINRFGRPQLEFDVYAAAYLRAARTLVEAWRNKSGYNDIDGCVVFYLYRHSLELYLKAILRRGSALLELLEQPPKARHPRRKAPGTGMHNLQTLFQPVEVVLERLRWDWDANASIPELRSGRAFRVWLGGLDLVDPQSHAFRYPVDRTGGASVPRAFTANVFSFALHMDGVLEELDGAATGIEEAWQAAAEARFEV